MSKSLFELIQYLAEWIAGRDPSAKYNLNNMTAA